MTDMQEKKKDCDAFEGGYRGLLIVLSAFMIQLIVFGTACSIGVFNVELLDYFDNDINGVALLTSTNIAFFLGAGPVANIISNVTSYRFTVMSGAFIVVVGIFSIAWINSLCGMIVVYGLLVGFGFCLTYVPSHVLCGLHYSKYRALSTGLATSGSGLGTAIFPPLVTYLIEVYTWKGALIFLAGLNSHVLIFGMLLLPPPSPSGHKSVKSGSASDDSAVSAMCHRQPSLKEIICKSFNVFCNFGFNVYFISNVLWNSGAAVFIAFGPEFFIERNLSTTEASNMLTYFGLGEFVGGVCGAIVGNIDCVNRMYIYISANIIGGIMILLLTLMDVHSALTCVSFSFGICFGIILGLLLILVDDLLGHVLIGEGLAGIMIANGIGAFTGPPIAGILRRSYGSYKQALFFASFTFFASGIISVIISLSANFWTRCRQCSTLSWLHIFTMWKKWR